jgi:group I intron endonuclease
MKLLNTETIQEAASLVGIYKIKINDKEYIGSSSNIKHRLKHHLWSMKNKKHHNRTMQNLYNKYGDSKIYFEIVEECDIEILIERESYYINTLSPYINHILDPVKLVRDDVYKKRLSEAGKQRYLKAGKMHNEKEVHMYSIDGVYIKSFKNSVIAALEVFRKTNNSSGISAVCNNRAFTAGDYRFSYEKLNKLPLFKKNYKQSSILQLSLNEDIIKEWDSITEAQDSLKISNIVRAIKKQLTAGGYKWKYKS